MPELYDPRKTYKVRGEIKESLRKMYKLTSLPAEEARVFRGKEGTTLLEDLGGMVGRIISLPFKGIKETGNMAEDVMRGASKLRVGPMGEGGEYTPKQVGIAQGATMLALTGLGGSVPGGGAGELELSIARKDAIKMLAKGGKSWLKGIKGEFPFATGMAEKTIGKFIRGVRRLPQEVLDPLESVEFKSMGITQGRVNVPEATLQLNPLALPKKVYNILGHEITHIEDLKPLLGKKSKTIKRAILEANPLISKTKDEAENLAYEVMDKVGDLLSKDKLDYESLKGIIGEYTATKNPQELSSLVKELGGEILNVKRDLLSEVMGLEKGFSKKAFQLGREIHKGEVPRREVESAFKAFKELKGIDPMEKATKGQYFSEALEFSEILGGKTKGLEGKVDFLRKVGEL